MPFTPDGSTRIGTSQYSSSTETFQRDVKIQPLKNHLKLMYTLALGRRGIYNGLGVNKSQIRSFTTLFDSLISLAFQQNDIMQDQDKQDHSQRYVVLPTVAILRQGQHQPDFIITPTLQLQRKAPDLYASLQSFANVLTPVLNRYSIHLRDLDFQNTPPTDLSRDTTTSSSDHTTTMATIFQDTEPEWDDDSASDSSDISLLSHPLEHYTCRCPTRLSERRDQEAVRTNLIILNKEVIKLKPYPKGISWDAYRGAWTLIDRTNTRVCARDADDLADSLVRIIAIRDSLADLDDEACRCAPVEGLRWVKEKVAWMVSSASEEKVFPVAGNRVDVRRVWSRAAAGLIGRVLDTTKQVSDKSKISKNREDTSSNRQMIEVGPLDWNRIDRLYGEAKKLLPYPAGVTWARKTARWFVTFNDSSRSQKKRFKSFDVKKYDESVGKAYEAAIKFRAEVV